ncbi:MAG: RNA ligase family protein [Verrucomicrobiae bacterium]|nr:RNA ligase family protein [Verrucomicrobiae bacterium]
MGASRDNFVKYPRTPHLFGSRGTDDDKHLGAKASAAFISDPSLIVEEKLDGTNVGIHFLANGRLFLQCRGHEITEGMHPQYDLFKQWAAVKRTVLESMLEDRYILFGEWLYAKHSVRYLALPHYFFEFDIYDKEAGVFLSLERRLERLEGTGVETVPVIHRGPLTETVLESLIGESAFGAVFEHSPSGTADSRMEGLYLRTEADSIVTGRAKKVRPEFVEKIKQSQHWQYRTMVPNELLPGTNLWS